MRSGKLGIVSLCTLFIVPILFFACKKESAQDPIKPQYHLYNGIIQNVSHPAVMGADGNIICTGMSNSGYLLLLKTGINGQTVFNKEIYIPQLVLQFSVAESGNGSIYVLSTTSKNFATTKYDILLVKFNNQGDTVWTKLLATPLNEYGYIIKKTRDGGIIVCGRVLQAGSSSISDFLVVRMDADGNEIWSKTFYTNASSTPTDLVETANGNFMIVGSTNSGTVYLLKLDSSGNKIGQNSLIFSGFIQPNCIAETIDGNFMCCGTNAADVTLFKIDGDCKLLWNRNLGYSDHNETGHKMVRNTDGSFTIAGTTAGPKTNNQSDILVMRASAEAEGLWYRAFGGKSADIGYAICKDGNEDNIIIGLSNSFTNNFVNQIFTVQIDNDGKFK